MSFKIALVSAFPPGTGSLNEYGFHLARELAAHPRVSEVVVIADKMETPAEELDMGSKVRVLRTWSFNSLAAGPAIIRTLRREGVDGAIWNLQTASFGDRELPAALGLMAPALARRMACPTGVIAHNLVAGVDLESTKLKGQAVRQFIVRLGGSVVTRVMLGATYTTVTLKSYADFLDAMHPEASVYHVPHGTFDTEEREVLPLAERPKRIVTMGKFGTYKRLETLLAAFDKLRLHAEFSDYELIIGGADHPGTPGYIRGLFAQRMADPAIKVHGYVAEDDIPEFLGTARISVFDYSATTGSSGVLHQTACYGALPVFPDIGDFIDVSRDEGLRGENYAPNDAEEMAEALNRSLSDLEAAQAIADSNLQASRQLPLSSIVDFHIRKLFAPAQPETTPAVSAAWAAPGRGYTSVWSHPRSGMRPRQPDPGNLCDRDRHLPRCTRDGISGLSDSWYNLIKR